MNLAPRADAIVILGCALRAGVPSPALIRRVECGVALFERGVAPVLLMCGGGQGRRPEAETMRDLAAARGVPYHAMLLEPRSRNTVENATEAARLMRSHDLATLVLVSDGYHMPRAGLLFRHAGLAVVATDRPPSRGVLRELPLRLRECIALPLSLARLLWAAARDRRASQ